MHVHVAVKRSLPLSYRAIRPVVGWTKKALERAARKIGITQGWEIEQSVRYAMNISGQIGENKECNIPQPKISQTARDVESHTGEESLELQAKREVSKILEIVKNWKDIHERLCSKGYLLERCSNGAVLKYGAKSVKLSNVSRSSSFSKMEQRLGNYQERPSNIQIAERVKKKTVVSASGSSWKQYKAERERYLDAKVKQSRNYASEKTGARRITGMTKNAT